MPPLCCTSIRSALLANNKSYVLLKAGWFSYPTVSMLYLIGQHAVCISYCCRIIAECNGVKRACSMRSTYFSVLRGMSQYLNDVGSRI
jgi:hypothetical protein